MNFYPFIVKYIPGTFKKIRKLSIEKLLGSRRKGAKTTGSREHGGENAGEHGA